MDASPPDRRIGRRLPIPARRVLWRVPAPGEKPRRLFGRRDPESAELLDVSVSGLSVRAREARDLSIGALVHLAVDGHPGPARIRAMAPEPGGRCTYGLELVDPASALTRHVYRKLEEAADVHEDAWNHRRTPDL